MHGLLTDVASYNLTKNTLTALNNKLLVGGICSIQLHGSAGSVLFLNCPEDRGSRLL